ncbi:MAG: type IV pilus assembly protein PilM [Bdellovibrionaceae bacterium]|nr:type IV pilus assembly protein PilM [Pseudobdellovibrionaceae bacterium]
MFFKKSPLGLDLGSSSIKIAEISMKGKKAVLQDFTIVPILKGAIESGDVVNPDSVAVAIRSSTEKKAYAKRSVVVGMFGGAVIVKKITMPKMDPKIVNEQLRWEAEQYIPFNIDEAVYDFHILGGQSTETMDILLVAARQEHIFRYFESVETAGMSCAVVDVNGIALANCFEFNYGLVPGTVALVNIGASVVNLVILESGNVVFARDIPYGGFLYDAEISRDLGVGPQEAESLKLGVAYQQATPPEVMAAIQSVNEMLSVEVNNSFDFYKSSGTGLSVDKIYVSGGVCLTPGLLDKIQEITTIKCEILDPFRNVEFNKKKISAEFFEQIRVFAPISLGLALRGSFK